MRHSVMHRITVRYDGDVLVSRNEVRMRPRDDATQRLLRFTLDAWPRGTGTAHRDGAGGHVDRVDVRDTHRALVITARSLVERRPHWPHTPYAVAGALMPPRHFAEASSLVPLGPRTRALARSWLGGTQGGPTSVAELTRRVACSLRFQPGITTARTDADHALAGGVGVCQDYAHLLIAVVRLGGRPARYVSGYLGPDAPLTSVVGETHAWVEVWDDAHPSTPGVDVAGAWVAWDPTLGRACDARHIPVATGRDAEDTAPLTGAVWGSGGRSTVETRVQVHRVGPALLGT